MYNVPAYDMSAMQHIYPFCPSMPLLAKAYVPFQYIGCVYPPMKGLDRGTIFPELDRPYGADPEYLADQ